MEIIGIHRLQEPIDNVGVRLRNGKILTYERAFAKKYHGDYDITEVQLYNIITGKRNV